MRNSATSASAGSTNRNAMRPSLRSTKLVSKAKLSRTPKRPAERFHVRLFVGRRLHFVHARRHRIDRRLTVEQELTLAMDLLELLRGRVGMCRRRARGRQPAEDLLRGRAADA